MVTNPSTIYFPPPGDDWQRVVPSAAGVDEKKLAEAVVFAEAHESTFWTPAIVNAQGIYDNAIGKQQWNELLGPIKPRGGPNGIILRHGSIVAEWGDTRRPEMGFSFSKNYMSLCAGMALQDALIRDLEDTVQSYDLDDGFDSPQNQNITWQQLLHQTSEWEGTLWDIPDRADRKTDTSLKSPMGQPTPGRGMQAPGTHWEYNDVRANRLSLSLLRVFRRSIPQVLKERVMDTIGASQDWEWPAYRNAYVEIDDERMPSVPGGGHWGGGIWMSARDHARMGLLVLNRGIWDGREVLPASCIEKLMLPSTANPHYASSWWLNPERKTFPAAPENSLFARGAETNVIWIVPDHDMVLVSAWVDSEHWNTLFEMVMASMPQ